MGLFSRAAKRVTNTLKRVRNTITGRRGAERLQNSPETRKAVAAAKPRSAAKSTRKVPRALEKAESAWKPRATSNFGANLENLRRGVRLAEPVKAKGVNDIPNNWRPFNRQESAPKKEKTQAEINAMAKKLGLERGAPALRRQNLLKLGLNAPPGAPVIGPLKGPIRLKGPAFPTRKKPRKAAVEENTNDDTVDELRQALMKQLDSMHSKRRNGTLSKKDFEEITTLLDYLSRVKTKKQNARVKSLINAAREDIKELRKPYEPNRSANGTEWGNAENLFNLSAQAAASAQPPPSPLFPASPPPPPKGKTGTNRNAELAGLFGAATPAASPLASPPINYGKAKRNTYDEIGRFLGELMKDIEKITQGQIDNLEILINEYETAINRNSGSTGQDRDNLTELKESLDYIKNRRRRAPPTPGAYNPFNNFPAAANSRPPTPGAYNPFNNFPAAANSRPPTTGVYNPFNNFPAAANSPSPRNIPLEDPIRNRTRSLLRQTREHFGNNASKHSGNAFSVQELRTLIEQFEERLGYGYGTAEVNMQDQELLDAAKGILAALERKAAENFDPVFEGSPKGANNRMANLGQEVPLPPDFPDNLSPAATPAAAAAATAAPPPPIRAPRRLNLQPPSPKAAAANNSNLNSMSDEELRAEGQRIRPLLPELLKKGGITQTLEYKRLQKIDRIKDERRRAREPPREGPGGAAAGAAVGRAGNSPVVAPPAAPKKKDKRVAPEDQPIDIAALAQSKKESDKSQAKRHLRTAIMMFKSLFDQYTRLIARPGQFQVTKVLKPNYREYLHQLRNKYRNTLPFITFGKLTAKFYILDTNLLEDEILLNGANSSILDRQAFEVYLLDPIGNDRRELNRLIALIRRAVEPFHATEPGRLFGTRKVPHTKEHEAALERLVGQFNKHIINLEYLYDMFADFFRVMARVKNLELSEQNSAILDTFPTELRTKASLTAERLTANKGNDVKVLTEINGMLDAANAVYVGIMDDLLRQQAAAPPAEEAGSAASHADTPFNITTVDTQLDIVKDKMIEIVSINSAEQDGSLNDLSNSFSELTRVEGGLAMKNVQTGKSLYKFAKAKLDKNPRYIEDLKDRIRSLQQKINTQFIELEPLIDELKKQITSEMNKKFGKEETDRDLRPLTDFITDIKEIKNLDKNANEDVKLLIAKTRKAFANVLNEMHATLFIISPVSDKRLLTNYSRDYNIEVVRKSTNEKYRKVK